MPQINITPKEIQIHLLPTLRTLLKNSKDTLDKEEIKSLIDKLAYSDF